MYIQRILFLSFPQRPSEFTQKNNYMEYTSYTRIRFWFLSYENITKKSFTWIFSYNVLV